MCRFPAPTFLPRFPLGVLRTPPVSSLLRDPLLLHALWLATAPLVHGLTDWLYICWLASGNSHILRADCTKRKRPQQLSIFIRQRWRSILIKHAFLHYFLRFGQIARDLLDRMKEQGAKNGVRNERKQHPMVQRHCRLQVKDLEFSRDLYLHTYIFAGLKEV